MKKEDEHDKKAAREGGSAADEVKDFVERFDNCLEGAREPFAILADIKEFVAPRMGNFILEKSTDPDKHAGDQDSILDETAQDALAIGAAGMQEGMMSRVRPWHRLKMEDPALNKRADVKEWLSSVERVHREHMERSNFYTASHTMYLELLAFATSCSFCLDDWETVFRYKVQTAGEYLFDVDERGKIDTVFRPIIMTPRQMVLFFGKERLSDQVMKLYENNKREWIRVMQETYFRSGYDIENKSSRNMPIGSRYLEMDTHEDDFLRVSGYHEWPCLTPRWHTSGSDVYGTGRGHDRINSTKMLQEMEQNILEATHQELDPAMMVPSGHQSELDSSPGAQNEVDDTQGKAVKRLFDFNFNIEHAQAKVLDIRERIRTGFFNDLFLMIANANRRPGDNTATEVLELKEEKLLMVGPYVSRNIDEQLIPSISRIHAMLGRAGRLPEPPEDIIDQSLKIEFFGMLAQAQQAAGMRSVERVLGVVERVAGFAPEAVDTIDPYKTIDEYGEMAMAPPAIFTTEEERKGRRQARAKQLAEETQMKQGMAGAEVASKLGNVKTGERNMVTEGMGA